VSQPAKQGIALGSLILLAVFMYLDRTHWHSFLSYRKEDPMTQCKAVIQTTDLNADGTAGTIIGHYKCLEGEVTLSFTVEGGLK
jgi:hypothetical protein